MELDKIYNPPWNQTLKYIIGGGKKILVIIIIITEVTGGDSFANKGKRERSKTPPSNFCHSLLVITAMKE
jgi:hypothetical protein